MKFALLFATTSALRLTNPEPRYRFDTVADAVT